jgi:hypothetical protein
VLLEANVSRADVERAFRAARSNRRRPSANYARLQDLAAGTIDRWYTDPDYLTDGEPSVLPRSGRAPSIVSLVARSVPRADRAAVLRVLAESPSISKNIDGTAWRCTDKVLRLRGPAKAALIARTIELTLRASLILVGILPRAHVPLHLHVEQEAVPYRLYEPFRSKALKSLVPVLTDLGRGIADARDTNTDAAPRGRLHLLTLVHLVPNRTATRTSVKARKR